MVVVGANPSGKQSGVRVTMENMRCTFIHNVRKHDTGVLNYCFYQLCFNNN